MPTLKLRYFDFHGGRGEVARLALVLGKIDFDDDRIPVREWSEFRDSTPFRIVPVLEVDGEAISESNAINRYVGRLANLYPDDSLEALRCDEVMDAVEDVITALVQTFPIKDEDEKRVAREALVTEPITLYLARLNQILESRGGEYFAAGRLTVADLKVFVWLKSLLGGVMDYVPTDLPKCYAPALLAQYERISAMPEIQEYYGS